jgi:HEAT repeat protein
LLPALVLCVFGAATRLGARDPDLAELKDKDVNVRRAAVAGIRKLGPGGKRAIPALVQTLSDEDNRTAAQAAMAIADIGADAVPHLAKELAREGLKPRTRILLIQTLGEIGGEARAVSHKLINLTQDKDPEIRCEAVSAIARVDGKSAVCYLASVLRQETDDRVKLALLNALAGFGPDAQKAVPVVVDMLRKGPTEPEEGYFIPSAAAECLASMGRPAVPALVEVLGDARTDPVARETALESLERILGVSGPDAAPEAIPILIQISTGNVASLRVKAVDVLGAYRRRAKAALPSLNRLLKSSVGSERVTIALALYRIDSENNHVHLGTLIVCLKDGRPSVRAHACRALHQIGRDAAPATLALADALSDPDPNTRLCAANALGGIGPPARAAVPALKRALLDEDEYVRRGARQALLSIESR